MTKLVKKEVHHRNSGQHKLQHENIIELKLNFITKTEKSIHKVKIYFEETSFIHYQNKTKFSMRLEN